MNFKRIFLICIFILIVTVGVVSASDENVIGDLTLDNATNLQMTDENQCVSADEDVGIDIEGPDVVYYAADNEFKIHAKSGVEGTVYCKVDMQAKYWVGIQNSSQDSVISMPVYVEEPGDHTIGFNLERNGQSYNLKSFNYTVDKFMATLKTYSTVRTPDKMIDVNMPSDASGKIVVEINGKTYKADKNYGDSYTDFRCYDYLNAGKNSATVTFTADSKSKHKSQTTNCTLIVYPDISIDYITYGSGKGINVYAPGLSGKLSYKVDGGEYVTSDVEGDCIVPLSNFSLGRHSIEINYTMGDIWEYLGENTFSVVPNVTVPNFIKNGTDCAVRVVLPEDVDGNLIVNLNQNEIYSSSNAKGIISIPLTNLQHYNDIEVKYSDANCGEDVQYFDLTCTNNSPKFDLMLGIEDIISKIYDTDNEFGVIYPDDFDGDITAMVDGKIVDSGYHFTYFGYGWNGTGYAEKNGYYYYSFDVDNLSLGKHTLTVIANNSQYYMPTNKSATFTLSNFKAYFSDPICYGDQIWGFYGPGDMTGTVKFYLDDKLIDTQKADSISFYIPDDTKFGKHTLKFVYSGDKKYPKETLTKKITYNYMFFPWYRNYMFFNLDHFAAGNKNVLTFEGPADFKGTVTLTIDGQKFTQKGNGRYFNFDISKIKAGNYTAKVEYWGSGKFAKQSYTMEIMILPKVVDIKASSVSVFYDSGSYYTIKILNTDGAPAQNIPFTYFYNGIGHEKKTDSNGIYKFKISQKPGTYTIEITCKYSTISKKITVKHVVSLAGVKVKKSAKKLTLTATLKRGKTPLKNQAVTFKFNGKTYNTKSNSKGIAKVTIKSAVLKKLKAGKKITYQATYKKDTVKKTVKVLK